MPRSLQGGSDEVAGLATLVIRPMIWRDIRGLGRVYSSLLGALLIVAKRRGEMMAREG